MMHPAPAHAYPDAATLWFVVRLLDYWEPGLVALVRRTLEAQTPKFHHLRDGGAGLKVSAGGRRVTKTRENHWDWAMMAPGVRGAGVAGGGGDGRCCWRVTVHRGDAIVGVIGTADPSGVEHGFSFHHATAFGWRGTGDVYHAGQSRRQAARPHGPQAGAQTDHPFFFSEPIAHCTTLPLVPV